MQRQVAVAHHAVLERAVDDLAVLYVDVADVAAEVLNGLRRRFTHIAVRVVHIPKGCDALAVNGIEQLSEPLRVGVDAVRLDEQRDAEALGDDAEHVEHVGDVVVVDLALRLGVQVGEHADVRRAEFLRQHDVLRDLHDVLVVVFFQLQAAAGSQAGNFKTKFL